MDNKKTPATSFVLITGAKVGSLKIIHHSLYDDSMMILNTFLRLKPDTFVKDLAHQSEYFRLLFDGGVFFHRTGQVVVVTGEIGMKEFSECMEDFLERNLVSLFIPNVIHQPQGVDKPDHVDAYAFLLAQIKPRIPFRRHLSFGRTFQHRFLTCLADDFHFRSTLFEGNYPSRISSIHDRSSSFSDL